MEDFWKEKIKAFLHDPPDKALIFFHYAHEKKAADIWESLGFNEDAETLRNSTMHAFPRIHEADVISSAMQRLHIPKEYRMDDANSCNRHICFKGAFKPVFKHTLSGEIEEFAEIRNFIRDYGYLAAIDQYGFNVKEMERFLDESDWRKTYFLIWRLLPEIYPLGNFLPADSRIPDHNIWDHLDVTAAIFSCLPNMGLLAVKLPAVQEFISHSRKLSDLWSSSHLFSALNFEGIREVVQGLGPDVVLFPQLRGNPLLDHFLQNLFEGIQTEKGRLTVANVPNIFLCFVPLGQAEELAESCKRAIFKKWKGFSDIALKILNDLGITPDMNLWNEQVENAFYVTPAWIEFFDSKKYSLLKEEEEIPQDLKERQENWLDLVETSEEWKYGHFYLPTYQMLGILLYQKSRLWDAWEEPVVTGRKCLMCGLRNAVVERRSSNAHFYWDGHKWKKVTIGRRSFFLRENERLCAVCTIKRLYGWRPESIFEKVYGVEPPEFESVVEIAGKRFINELKKSLSEEEYSLLKMVDVELIYKHEWESKEKKATTIKFIESLSKNVAENIKKKLDELWKKFEPNKYYAVLMMDGDRIGKMLSGETLPNFEEFLHPIFRSKIKEWEKSEKLFDTKRVLTPSVHMAISRAMKDFSIYKVQEIVEKNGGFLVYSGGDDVLAFFPTEKVLGAANELQECFKKAFYEIEVDGGKRKAMALGKNASMSAGIAFAHYKYPLYDVMEKVRAAERRAKNEYGRDAFCLTFLKRSGVTRIAGGKWKFVPDFLSIVGALLGNGESGDGIISTRFIYDFLDATRILSGDKLKAEVKRILSRRKVKEATAGEIDLIHGWISNAIDNYEEYGLPVEDIGKTLKILYDAYRGEAE
ncbi:MAG: type III-B CRISPR-associated protein Cas10/Cmr2 [Candidatus Freyarchaeota archaeon]